MRPGAGDAVGDGVDVGASVGAAPTVGLGVVTVAAGAHALRNISATRNRPTELP